MQQKKIAILGSTGSIGTQAVEIISSRPEHFKATTLTANSSYEKLAEQVNTLKPNTAVLCDKSREKDFLDLLKFRPQNILFGKDSLEQVTLEADYDILLNSLVGFSGFNSTYKALEAGKKVALANKESLVVGGEILSKLEGFINGNLIPVDSEHSAMLQSIVGERKNSIKKIIITASGGPFKNYTRDQLMNVTVKDALNHPNWNMGSKITIDSATMMNKGLEIIEAKWFFDLPIEQIEPVVHPQSIIHSIVEFVDGSSKAQLGPPDMKVPILYALTYPDRIDFPNKTLNYTESILMEFEPVNFNLFPCIQLAIEAAKNEGLAPAILNAANEIAVERFLNSEIRYIDIPKIIENSLTNIHNSKDITPETLYEVDKETREYANALLQ